MGAGASMDSQRDSDEQTEAASSRTRFYCHECHRSFLPLPSQRDSPDLRCNFCNSSFLEEIELPMQIRRRHYELSDEQTRRLTSAAALLQMLEAQLRDELEMLQSTLAMNNGNSEQKLPPFTQGMRDVLKHVKTNIDMICEQPSCPICSEDYTNQEAVTKLPCDHIYHKDCVMPWLESKRTCPICRFELKHTVVPCGELEQLSKEELKYRISARVTLDDEIEQENVVELAARLHEFLEEEQKQIDEHEREQRSEPEGRRVLLVSASDLRSSMMGRGGGMLRGSQHPRIPLIFRERESTSVGRHALNTMDSDDEEEEDSNNGAQNSGQGVNFGSLSGQHVRVINYPSGPGGHGARGGPHSNEGNAISRMIITTSVGEEDDDEEEAASGLVSRGFSSQRMGGTSALGNSNNHTVVYRRNNSADNNNPPVATLMTEANQPGTTLSSSNYGPSSHVPSSRLMNSGQSSLLSPTISRDDVSSTDINDIDEGNGVSMAQAAFQSSLENAQATMNSSPSSNFVDSQAPISTTYIVRSSDNGTSHTVVPVTGAMNPPVVNPPPDL